MTDDKEERRTITESELMSVVDSWTHHDLLPLGHGYWLKLPLAPKHTEEEYDLMERSLLVELNRQKLRIKELDERRIERERHYQHKLMESKARIKELEARK